MNPYLNRITNIEYSRLPGYAGNSELHFRKAAADGFDGLKADMRLSADGEIVLCHDPGYTLGKDGRIIAFDEENFRAIHDMTLSEILSLEFDTPDENGCHYGPCTIDTVLAVCKEYGIIPYLTNRHEDWRVQTAERMAEKLETFGLTGKAIMNLYSGDPDTMRAIRTFIPDAAACDTKHDYDLFSREMIDASADAGYKIICLCHRSKAPVTRELTDYAREKGVSVWEWGMTAREDVKRYLDLGITGFQMYTRDVTNSVIRSMGY